MARLMAQGEYGPGHEYPVDGKVRGVLILIWTWMLDVG